MSLDCPPIGEEHSAPVAVEALARSRSRCEDGRGQSADVDVALRGDFSRHHHQTGGDQGLDGNPAVRVLREDASRTASLIWSQILSG